MSDKQTVPAKLREEIRPLTSFRAWAALFVFLHHDLLYFHRWGAVAGPGVGHGHGDQSAPWWIILLREGRVGVTMFFVLSGFLLTLRYYDSLFRGASLKTYVLKRVARIWPLFLFVCGLTFLYDVVYKQHYLFNPDLLKQYIVYFTMTQGFFMQLRFGGVGTAWSLSVEECFYMALPLAILAFRKVLPKEGRPWLSLLNAALVLSAMTAIFFVLGKQIANRDIELWGFFDKEHHHWHEYTIFGRFGDFALGIAAAVIYMRSSNWLLSKPALVDIGVAACLGLLGWSVYQFYYQPIAILGQSPYHYVASAASAALIYLLCAPRSLFVWANSGRFLVYMGRISYAFYLVHIVLFLKPFYRRVYLLDQALGLDIETSPVLVEAMRSFGAMAIGVLFSIFCYEAVERPCQKLILKWTGVFKPRPEGAAAEEGEEAQEAAPKVPVNLKKRSVLGEAAS